MAPDLGDVAAHNGLSVEEVIRIHARSEYLVYFLGFSPGFPYLGDLPTELATPRLKTPRLRVPAGSVAIGGSQTGIYPVDSPGGWRLIGRTPLPLFSPEKDPPTLLQMGDRVHFVPITMKEFNTLRSTGDPMPMMRVLKPGFLTTVQDLGRFGYAHLGISASGAADPVSLRIGNRLLDNDPSAPALEMTLVGGEFLFEEAALVAVTGSDFGPTLDGAAVPQWTSVPVRAGQVLRFGAAADGARCYLCVRGGFKVEKVLGSASTHLITGIGGFQGRPLRKGDALP